MDQKKNPVLNKHRQWLQQFKTKVAEKQEQQLTSQQQQQEKIQRIREHADKAREKFFNRSTINDSAVLIESTDNAPTMPVQTQTEKPKPAAQVVTKSHRAKKGERPAWAMTDQQIVQKQQAEVDELLDFFNNTDIQQFIDEVQVNALMKSLKDKISEIKKDTDWKEKNKQKWQEEQERRRKLREAQANDDEDKRTNVSKQSVAKSVASQKASQRIQQLKDKLAKKEQGEEEWDNRTKTTKTAANIQQKIAKNVADELLRNYGNLKAVHSNLSVRKMLEREAARQLNEANPA